MPTPPTKKTRAKPNPPTASLSLIVYDDGQGLLSPLTDLRPAFDIRTGARTTLERIETAVDASAIALFVPEPLAALTRERHGAGGRDLPVNSLPGAMAQRGNMLLVNGRCPLVAHLAEFLAYRPSHAPAPPALVDAEGTFLCGLVGPGDLQAIVAGSNPKGLAVKPAIGDRPRAAISRPWHVRAFRDECIRNDLAKWPGRISSTPKGCARIGKSALRIARTARIYPTAVFDLENGPIVIDENAVIRPGAIICGPAYIGPHTTILDRALIKPNCAFGPHCKVAGEVGGTIIQGYSNKAHDGHLGDSWLGEWVNLGAGTTNSNLLNTYGEVIARALPDGPNERTGETFLGCILGDHVKTAICTRIMTGAIVGTGTMYAASAPISGTIPAFSWCTDGGMKSYRFEKMAEVLSAVAARRRITPSASYVSRLRQLAGPGGQ